MYPRAMLPQHPVDDGKAAVFHGTLAAYFVVGIALFALGVWFHATSAVKHLDDFKAGR